MLATETYDANGNTLTTGNRTFTYDFEKNHVKSMNGTTVTLQYDGDGNRVAKTVGGATTRYVVDELNPTGYAQVVEETAGTAVQRTYTYGHQRISQNQVINSTWTPTFYGYDGFGNARTLTNATGAATDLVLHGRLLGPLSCQHRRPIVAPSFLASTGTVSWTGNFELIPRP